MKTVCLTLARDQILPTTGKRTSADQRTEGKISQDTIAGYTTHTGYAPETRFW